jgi:hypothetical protein
MFRRWSFVVVLAALCVGLAAPGASAQGAAGATVEGPIAGNTVVTGTGFDLSTVGYEQAEYFLSGTASSYTNTGPLSTDGKWTVSVKDSAPYKTRIVVYRPTDAAKFNGTVVVEWMNVTSGMDTATDWMQAHVALIRDGYAYVGVSAQRVGLEGIPGSQFAALAPKGADPGRYGTLNIPNDNYSYDIFTQAGRAVRDQAATVLGGLTPKQVLATGESQSAIRLTTYLDAVAPTAKAFDGYLLHSRSNLGAPLFSDQSGQQFATGNVNAPNPTLIRTDLGVPVLNFSTETDLYQLGYLWARQPDSATFRGWEVPGTAHADSYTLGISRADTGDGKGDIELFQSMLTPTSKPYGLFDCASPVNGGQQTYAFRSAVIALNKWVESGTPPKSMPRVPIDPNQPSKRLLAGNGMVKGGVRTPALQAPVATLTGVGQSGSSFCALFGTTTPYTSAQLAKLYPSHAAFTKAWNSAVDAAVKAGVVLEGDAQHVKDAAAQSNVGK